MENRKLNKMVKITLLGTIGFLLMMIEVIVPLFPEFLKVDISDLPALIGTFAFGPLAGVTIELIKNILHGIFMTKTMFIGEIANFAVGSVLVITAGTIYNAKKTRKVATISLIVGTLVMSVVGGILNYFVLLPLYEKVLHFPITAMVAAGRAINSNITDLNSFVVWTIVPFNLVKGSIVAALTMAIYKSVSPILHAQEGVKNKKITKES